MATVGVKGLTINCYVHVDVEPITLTYDTIRYDRRD